MIRTMGFLEFIIPAAARILAVLVALATIAHPLVVAASLADDDAVVCAGIDPDPSSTDGDEPVGESGEDQDTPSDEPTVTISVQHVWDRPARSHHRVIVNLPAGPSLGQQGYTRLDSPLPIPPDAALTTEVRTLSQAAVPQRPHAPPPLS